MLYNKIALILWGFMHRRHKILVDLKILRKMLVVLKINFKNKDKLFFNKNKYIVEILNNTKIEKIIKMKILRTLFYMTFFFIFRCNFGATLNYKGW